MQRDEKKDNEVTDPVPISSFNLFFTKQQSTSSRTPRSGTVILLYRNKRKVRASISYRNRRSDPSVGVEYCTFFSHHVSHDKGAVESAMVLITLNMGCFFCLCFVLNCYFVYVYDLVDFCGLDTCTLDTGCFFCFCFVLNCYFEVFAFVVSCGLDTCTLNTGCCVLKCCFNNVEFDYYVYNLCFLSRSCQHLLSTNPFIVDLTMDGNVEANPGPRKRRSNLKSTHPSKITRKAIFDQQTSKHKRKRQQKALNREICKENTILNNENRKILTKQTIETDGFKPNPLIQFKSMNPNQNLSTVMCFDLETYQDGHLYQSHDGQFLPPDELINKKRKESANLLKKKTDEQMDEWIFDQKVFLISIVIGRFDHHNFFLRVNIHLY
ncbi:hypothetical protein P9112_002486 [Eukaryota sp. TZLM1-RC]